MPGRPQGRAPNRGTHRAEFPEQGTIRETAKESFFADRTENGRHERCRQKIGELTVPYRAWRSRRRSVRQRRGRANHEREDCEHRRKPESDPQ